MLQKMRTALRDMPVPEPSEGFVERVIANATRNATRNAARGAARGAAAAPGVRASLRRSSTWWAAGIGALAATLACVALLWWRASAAEPSLVLTLNESRDVPLVIQSERNLDGAHIRIYVSGSVALTGYEQQQEVEWMSSLTQGANLLSLPVVARQAGEGRIVAEIEHQGKTRRVSVSMHVLAPARRGNAA